jgi:hypothetical protein
MNKTRFSGCIARRCGVEKVDSDLYGCPLNLPRQLFMALTDKVQPHPSFGQIPKGFVPRDFSMGRPGACRLCVTNETGTTNLNVFMPWPEVMIDPRSRQPIPAK